MVGEARKGGKMIEKEVKEVRRKRSKRRKIIGNKVLTLKGEMCANIIGQGGFIDRWWRVNVI